MQGAGERDENGPAQRGFATIAVRQRVILEFYQQKVDCRGESGLQAEVALLAGEPAWFVFLPFRHPLEHTIERHRGEREIIAVLHRPSDYDENLTGWPRMSGLATRFSLGSSLLGRPGL